MEKKIRKKREEKWKKFKKMETKKLKINKDSRMIKRKSPKLKKLNITWWQE